MKFPCYRFPCAGCSPQRQHPIRFSRKLLAFSLLEMLVATTILILIMMIIAAVISLVNKTWKDTTAKLEAFADARAAFDQITVTLSQAVLNTYWDYDNATAPTRYERRSELQFLTTPMSGLGLNPSTFPTQGIFFQAPTGKTGRSAYDKLPNLLNAYGYFVEFGSDSDDLPTFLQAINKPKYRFRLKQWQVPAENFLLYCSTTGTNGKNYLGAASCDWIKFSGASALKPRTFAENIIALIVLPRGPRLNAATPGGPLTADYVYNSRSGNYDEPQYHQLPPVIEVVMVAIDEPSAIRWIGNNSTPPEGWMPSGAFKNPDDLEKDLNDLRKNLDELNIRHVVMRSNVTIRGARWSDD